jgi:DNA-binding LacI/PurR family transcriptional regulator
MLGAIGTSCEARTMTKQSTTSPTAHVNLRTLAEHLQLSQTTVSLVLNNSPSAKSIPKSTRQRVVEAAKRLNYRPNYFARSLRRNESMSIGVLAPDLSEGYFTRVMSGVVQELNSAHYFFFTACHYWNEELLERYPRMLIERAVDGFLLLNTEAPQLDVPVPVATISAHCAIPQATNIVLDHVIAARLALKHLYDLGHRRIALMRGPSAIPDSKYRWAGIEKAASDLGVRIDPALAIHLDGNNWRKEIGMHPMDPQIAYGPTQALLQRKRNFTALFSFNDIAAMGAIRAIRDAGLNVPADISVVGFDDTTSAAFSTPSLTTVRQPLFEMGQKAAQILLEKIADREKQFPTIVEMRPELVVRESTGPAKKQRSRSVG